MKKDIRFFIICSDPFFAMWCVLKREVENILDEYDFNKYIWMEKRLRYYLNRFHSDFEQRYFKDRKSFIDRVTIVLSAIQLFSENMYYYGILNIENLYQLSKRIKKIRDYLNH